MSLRVRHLCFVLEVIFSLFFFFRQAIEVRIAFCFFSGKILEDDTALKEYKINDKNFVVVMASKVCQMQFILVFGHRDSDEL